MKVASWFLVSAAIFVAYLGPAGCRDEASKPVTTEPERLAPEATPRSASKSGNAAEPASPLQTELAPAEKPKVYTQQIPEAELVRDLGVTKGEPIDSGFVFLDGQYLDAPYIVTRKGLLVYLNDQEVYRVFLPKKEPPSGEVDPKLPPQITRDTSINDEMFRKHWQQKVAYVQKHHSSEEEARIIEKWFRNLPFIKEARLHPKHEGYLNITTYGGETASVALVVPRRKGKFDRQTVLGRSESERERLEKALVRGRCMFFFTKGGSMTVPTERLPKMVEVLRSKVSAEKKFERLEMLGIQVGPDSFSEVVTNFSASGQLEKRLKEALSEDKSEPAK